MKEIPLTQGKVALVDDEDYEWLTRWKWTACKDKDNWYAMRREGYPKRRNVKMHRVVINAPSEMEVDHRDRNGLNNQKYNLRLCNTVQNSRNRRVRSDSRTGVKGVVFRVETEKYRVTICVNGKRKNLGQYDTIEDAAKAYNKAALKYFGEFANLNHV